MRSGRDVRTTERMPEKKKTERGGARRDEREKIRGGKDGRSAAPRGRVGGGRGRPRYTGTLAIFSSMHTSTGTSCMHSAYSASCTTAEGGAARRGGAGGGHETMKNARAAIYYLRVQVTTAERAQSLRSLPLPPWPPSLPTPLGLTYASSDYELERARLFGKTASRAAQ